MQAIQKMGGLVLGSLALFSPDDVKPKVHVVQPGEMVLRFEKEARLDSAERTRVRIVTEAYSGILEIQEVYKRSGFVNQGDKLFQLDSTRIDEEIKNTKDSLETIQRRLGWAKDEQRIQAEAQKTQLERMVKSKADADREWEIFQKYEGPKMLKVQELNIQGRENGLADQKEELAQLESMYKGTRLATETKEIVLDRARRGVQVSEAWLQIAKEDRIVSDQYRYPDRKKDVEDQVRYNGEGLAHTEVNIRIASERKREEIENITKSLKDTADRLAKLEKDRKAFTIVAPASGLMTSVDFKVGDTIGSRQQLAEILNTHHFTLKFNASAEDLRVISEGKQLQLGFPEYPEINGNATITEISNVGYESGTATNFSVTAKVDVSSPHLRVGLRCRLTGANEPMKGIYAVPAKTVRWKDGKYLCSVWKNGKTEDLEVIVGPTSADMTQVVKGLNNGDEVLLEEKK